MNILLTSAGRRSYLVEHFVNALGARGSVHVGNSDPLCSAFTVPAKRVITPGIYTSEYIPFLKSYCKVHAIDSIVPLFDVDLPILARAKDEFELLGTTIVVADTAMVEMANDKWSTSKFLKVNGLMGPRTWLKVEEALKAVKEGHVSFPLMVKPRWGMGSIGLMKAESASELPLIFSLVERRVFSSYLQHESMAAPSDCVLIQECLSGDEFGMDVFNDLSGNHVTTSVKLKLAMRSGETDVAETRDVAQLRVLGAKLGNLIGHPGNIDVDVFWDGEIAKVLEINCRFGGGYPFTHLAGANFPAALVAWLCGEKPREDWLKITSKVTGLKAIHPMEIDSSLFSD